MKKREFNCRQLEKSIDAVDNIDHVLDGLSDEYTVLIKQKYVYGMTMEEMGRQNGYSRETARRRFKKALKSFEKINPTKNKIEINRIRTMYVPVLNIHLQNQNFQMYAYAFELSIQENSMGKLQNHKKF